MIIFAGRLVNIVIGMQSGRYIHHFALTVMAVLMSSAISAQGLPYSVIGEPSGTSPNFFGPSAFPVPDMVKNTTDRIRLQVNTDVAWGNLAPTTDYASTLGFDIRIPLFTERVNLSVWGQVHEWYWDTPEVREARGVDPKYNLNGDCSGEAYLSADVLLVKERKLLPSLTMRVALKTASGDDYEKARYYDAPGYFFDACATKNISLGGVFFKSISASLNFGFVCWQKDIGCQNDAWLYAGSLALDTKLARLSVDLGTYAGQEHYFDKPAMFKSRLDFLPDRMVSFFFLYQKGVRDWPFQQARVGLTVALPKLL